MRCYGGQWSHVTRVRAGVGNNEGGEKTIEISVIFQDKTVITSVL